MGSVGSHVRVILNFFVLRGTSQVELKCQTLLLAFYGLEMMNYTTPGLPPRQRAIKRSRAKTASLNFLKNEKYFGAQGLQ